MQNSVAGAIAEALSPYIGRTMAQSSIDIHCKKLGIESLSTLDAVQTDQLLQRLTQGLRVFIGRDKTDLVMQSIRSTIGGIRQ